MKKLFQFLLPLMLCLICGISSVSAAENITSWAQLKAAMESATEPTTIVLTQDIVATAEDKAISPAETSIELDLNGYTLDRNLSEPGSGNNGCVFFMQRSLIDLTIKDSSPAKTGVITGGYATDCAGCIELDNGSLTLLGGTVTGNKTLYYGGGIDKLPNAKLVVGGTARVIGNYAYETDIKQWNSDIHFNDNILDGFSFATGDDALVTEGEHKAQFGIRFWTGADVPEVLWHLPSAEVGECFVSNNQREKYMSQAKLVNGNWTLCLLFHDHEFDGEICTSKCELCGLIREDGIHNMTGDGCTRECSWCHIKFHSDDTYDSKGVCPECKAHRVDDGTLLDYQGVRYRLKVDSKLNTYAEVYGYADDIKESVVIPKTIATSNGVFRVASFANGCFQGCTRVKDVDIQAEVTFIANSTFKGCSNLTSVVIPNSVTEIRGRSFEECSSLTNITIPDGVTKIGFSTFEGCSKLVSIVIPNGVTEIEDGTFEGCSNLTSVVIPNSVTEIGDRAFKNCSSLASINLPKGVTKIKDSAFEGCSSLTSINLPEGLTTIGSYAFRYCSSLTDVTIPSSVISVVRANPPFEYCSSDKLVITVPCTEYLNTVTPTQWGNIKEINRVHDFTAEEAKGEALKSAATCLDKAVYYRSCSVCGHVHESDDDVFEYGSALGHEYTSETTIAPYLKSKATCIKNAVYYHKCSRCESKGATTWTKAGSALGHDWGEYILEGDQTCEEDGHKTAMCTREGCTVTNTIEATGAALGHDYTSETATAPYLKSKATCIADAVYFHKCSRCESRGATTWLKEGSALGHDWEDYFTTDIAATCTEAGSESRHCARCSATTDVAPIVAHGHSFTDYISNGDATTEADGTKTAVCDHGCGETDIVIDEGSRIGLQIKDFQIGKDITLYLESGVWVCHDPITIEDGIALNSPVNFVADKVVYSRLANKDTMTIILPYDVPASDVNGQAYQLASFDGQTLKYEKVNDGLKANVPYLIYKNRGGETNLPLVADQSEATVHATATIDTVRVNDGKTIEFGAFTQTVFLSGDNSNEFDFYGYKNGKFIKAKQDITVSPFRVAVRLTKPSMGNRNMSLKSYSINPNELGVVFDDDVTGVDIYDSNIISEGKVNVYDVLGRAIRLNVDAENCLDGLKDGVYVVNGNKVIIKTDK